MILPGPEPRQLHAKDAQLLSDLSTICFHEAYEGVHFKADRDAYCASAYSTEKMRELLTDQRTHCLIMELSEPPLFRQEDKKQLGYMITQRQPCPHSLDTPATELKQIYLRASQYGTGMAEDLLTAATIEALLWSSQLLWLSVSRRNERAQRFYKKHGFEELGPGPEFQVGRDHLTSIILGKTPAL